MIRVMLNFLTIKKLRSSFLAIMIMIAALLSMSAVCNAGSTDVTQGDKSEVQQILGFKLFLSNGKTLAVDPQAIAKLTPRETIRLLLLFDFAANVYQVFGQDAHPDLMYAIACKLFPEEKGKTHD